MVLHSELLTKIMVLVGVMRYNFSCLAGILKILAISQYILNSRCLDYLKFILSSLYTFWLIKNDAFFHPMMCLCSQITQFQPLLTSSDSQKKGGGACNSSSDISHFHQIGNDSVFKLQPRVSLCKYCILRYLLLICVIPWHFTY